MKALALDSTRAEVHYTLALMYTWGMFDWQAGENEFKKAIVLKPAYPEARAYYSHLLKILGRKQEANEHGLLATRQDPANPLVISLYAVDLLMSRQFETAIKTADDALKIDPTAGVALFARASGLYHLGKYEEAFNAFKLCYSIAYKDFPHVFDQNYLEGSFSQLMKLEADAYSEMSKKTYFSANDIAILYILAGDKSKALDMLEKAFEEKDPNLPYLLMPIWDGLRDDLRFQDIAKKLNVPYR
jgi:tetratricopeptide (TPR) repeat protein